MNYMILIMLLVWLVVLVFLLFAAYLVYEASSNLDISLQQFNEEILLLTDVLKEYHEYIEVCSLPTINISGKNDSGW